jgi:hypothetical protein
MARGAKYNDDIREKAYALLATNNNVQYVSKELGLPYTTVKTWRDKWLRQVNEGENDGVTNPVAKQGTHNLAELRNKKKEEFVNNAWELIENSMTVACRRVERAVRLEKSIDIVAEAILNNAASISEDTGIVYNELLAIVKELENFKNFRLSEISSLIGTMYDKQALINKEATGILDCSVKKFEEFD